VTFASFGADALASIVRGEKNALHSESAPSTVQKLKIMHKSNKGAIAKRFSIRITEFLPAESLDEGSQQAEVATRCNSIVATH
jgi:hypothetical protein